MRSFPGGSSLTCRAPRCDVAFTGARQSAALSGDLVPLQDSLTSNAARLGHRPKAPPGCMRVMCGSRLPARVCLTAWWDASSGPSSARRWTGRLCAAGQLGQGLCGGTCAAVRLSERDSPTPARTVAGAAHGGLLIGSGPLIATTD